MGVLRRQRVKALPFSLRHHAALIFEHKMGAAHHHLLAACRAGNAVGHQVFHLGVHLLMGKAPLTGRLDHRVGHGVGEVLLQAGT